jgi:hypothetical protein
LLKNDSAVKQRSEIMKNFSDPVKLDPVKPALQTLLWSPRLKHARCFKVKPSKPAACAAPPAASLAIDRAKMPANQ